MIKIEPSYEDTWDFIAEVNGVGLHFTRHNLSLQYEQSNLSFYEKMNIVSIFNLDHTGNYILYNNTLKIIFPVEFRLTSDDSVGYRGTSLRIERFTNSPSLVGFIARVTEEDFFKINLGGICD